MDILIGTYALILFRATSMCTPKKKRAIKAKFKNNTTIVTEELMVHLDSTWTYRLKRTRLFYPEQCRCTLRPSGRAMAPRTWALGALGNAVATSTAALRLLVVRCGHGQKRNADCNHTFRNTARARSAPPWRATRQIRTPQQSQLQVASVGPSKGEREDIQLPPVLQPPFWVAQL